MEYGRKIQQARAPRPEIAAAAGGPSRSGLQKPGNFEKRLYEERGSARKEREAMAAMRAQKEADELASRTVTKKQEINFTHYEGLHKAHHLTQRKLTEKRARIAQEELDAIKQLQKNAGMKVQVAAAGKRGRPRVADLPSTAKASEIGKVHRQLAEAACVKQRGTGPGTTHFLRTSTKDTLYRTAIETALREERTRSLSGESRTKETAKPRRTQQTSTTTRYGWSPAMERLTRPHTPPISPEELPHRASHRSSSPLPMTAVRTDSAWKERTLAAQEKRAMSPILRRSARGHSAKPPASPSLSSAVAKLWCKRCSAAFAAECCPQNHAAEHYCALPPSTSKTQGRDIPAGAETLSTALQLDAAMQSLACGPGGQKAAQAASSSTEVDQQRPGLDAETAAATHGAPPANHLLKEVLKDISLHRLVKRDIHKLAISALKHAVAADHEYKSAESARVDSSSQLHAAIAAYKRAEELLAAVQESDTVKDRVKQALQAKIQPAVARRAMLEQAAQTELQRSADFVTNAKQALSETEWGAARFAAEEQAASGGSGATVAAPPSPRAARPGMKIEHWLQEAAGAQPIAIDAFAERGLTTLGDLAAYTESRQQLGELFSTPGVADMAWRELELINDAGASSDEGSVESVPTPHSMTRNGNLPVIISYRSQHQ